METKNLILAVLTVLACLLCVTSASKSERAKKRSLSTSQSSVTALDEPVSQKGNSDPEESHESVVLVAVVTEDEALKALKQHALELKYL